jgi:hypothetical protein
MGLQALARALTLKASSALGPKPLILKEMGSTHTSSDQLRQAVYYASLLGRLGLGPIRQADCCPI